MSDFTQAVKFLDLVPARKATNDELANSGPFPSDKYYSLYKTRDIKKIYTFIILPQTLFATGLGILRGQFNIVAPQDFYLLNANEQSIGDNISGAILTVKWRVGTTVYRYIISLSGDITLDQFDYARGFEVYTNQLIQQNCCFELWNAGTITQKYPSPAQAGIQEAISLQTSIIANPSIAESIQLTIDESSAFKNRNAIGFIMPATMPISQPTIVWNNN